MEMVDIHWMSLHPCLVQTKHCFAEKLLENSENSLLLILSTRGNGRSIEDDKYIDLYSVLIFRVTEAGKKYGFVIIFKPTLYIEIK